MRRTGGKGPTEGKDEYRKLERQLLLLNWLNRRFGYKSNRDLLTDLKNTREGFDDEGRSYIRHHLRGRGDKIGISQEDLDRYDDNIRTHLKAVNERRSEPVTLRYFQYLAALYAEILLDRRARGPGELLRSLNGSLSGNDGSFTGTDLQKMAFWMATGSGKTLLMHFNYRQFLAYNRKPLDNILLITPNEGLSEQHEREMKISGIPCRRFDLQKSGLHIGAQNEVRIIEITKLVKKKRGGGASVPVEAFEGNNLIFVDEGHKGSGGDAWRSVRERLGETGFTFEYSATFGQALTAARKDNLTREYGKAIAFDYSYRYFYGDGYGKDFHILNLQEETAEEQTELLLLGNLLSFHEQQLIFESQSEELRDYNLEKPLWVFVGSSVNAVYSINKRKRSDVLTVARFLHRVLANRDNWAVQAIEKLIAGESGLATERQDLFADRFSCLRKAGMDADSIYRNILHKMFHTQTSGGLHLCNLRSRTGEIGLQASGAEKYFGLIYIGDVGAFRKLAMADPSGLSWEERAIDDALFQNINRPDSPVQILVGAKKFMEGWNSWRVSNMGLLNVGRSEGSEIIQLFGRGVRLRGRGMSLKRSAAIDGTHPENIRLLERLNIFAVRANYMSQFRQYLEREGVDTEGKIEISLPIETNTDFLRQGLLTPRTPENLNFDENSVLLEQQENLRVRADLSSKMQTLESGEKGVDADMATSGAEQPIPEESFQFIDWGGAYADLQEYKEQKGMRNLAIPFPALKNIIESQFYELTADDAMRRPRSPADVERLNDAVRVILRKYVDKFYRGCKERWHSENMVYRKVDEKDANLLSVSDEEKPHYKLRIPEGDEELRKSIEDLIAKGDALYRKDQRTLPAVHFDRHLYQPLLMDINDRIKSDPPGLRESERQFVEHLREYCRKETESLKGGEIFLLRNLGRGKGVSFFETRGFYPDFILWIKQQKAQRIVFIEPHGMIYAESYRHDEKARLHERLPGLAEEIRERTGTGGVTLDSFIISATEYKDLHKRYPGGEKWDRNRFAEHHILFPEKQTADYDYIRIIMQPPAA